MMKKIQFHRVIGSLFSFLLLVIFATSCKNKQATQVTHSEKLTTSAPTKLKENEAHTSESQPAAESNKLEETPKQLSPKSEKTATLLVSFYSIGGGIDTKTAQAFDNFISGYKTGSNKLISYDRVPWGREGELDYCINFSELSFDETNQFIEASKAKIKDCKMVHFKQNGECKRKR